MKQGSSQSVKLEFVICEWAAYGPGLSQHQPWLDWAMRDPVLPGADGAPWDAPALSEMPAMMRRRIDRLGRLACQVAYWCQPGDQADTAGIPLVFASRYGDAARSLALLGDLVQGEPLSPTGFGLSVHNAASALYSIARGDRGNTVVVAAGRATVEAALVEACALLADGAPQVLVVFYEAALPADYAVFHDEAPCEYAWAWRVAAPEAARAGQALVSLQLEPDTAPAAAQALPAGLAVLRQVLRQLATPAPEAPLLRHDRADLLSTWKTRRHA